MQTLLNRHDPRFATRPSSQHIVTRNMYTVSSDVAFSELYMISSSRWCAQTTFVALPQESVHGRDASSRSINFHELVRSLKDHGLPISAIAEIGRVERKTVYAWLQGGAAKPHNEERMEILYRMLVDEGKSSLRHLYRLWRKPIYDGKSLSSLLSAEHLDRDVIYSTLTVCWPIASKYETNSIKTADPETRQNGENPIIAEIPELFIDDPSVEDSR